jgi:poly-D-alanine transfer protein DltD
MDVACEWADFDVLLRALRELGAEPLVVIVPPNAGYLAYGGVTPRALDLFHARIRAVAAGRGVPVVDFAGHDSDKFFFADHGHLSSRGWIYFARVLDAFYHGERGAGLAAAAQPLARLGLPRP